MIIDLEQSGRNIDGRHWWILIHQRTHIWNPNQQPNQETAFGSAHQQDHFLYQIGGIPGGKKVPIFRIFAQAPAFGKNQGFPSAMHYLYILLDGKGLAIMQYSLRRPPAALH